MSQSDPMYVLICLNSVCQLRLPIGRPNYSKHICPRCNSPMVCRREA